MRALSPAYKVIMNGKDVTSDITPYVSSVDYSASMGEQSDQVTLVFDNASGLFTGAWYPPLGMTMEISMGYDGELFSLGKFQIDTIDVDYSPAQVTLHALGVGVSTGVRTKKTITYSSSIDAIAKDMARDNGWNYKGSDYLAGLGANYWIQLEKSDLDYLNELAAVYGVVFTIQGDNLIYYAMQDLVAHAADNSPLVLELQKSIILSCRYSAKINGTVNGGTAAVYNERTGDVYTADETTPLSNGKSADKASNNTKIGAGKVKSKAEAQSRAAAADLKANLDNAPTLTITTQGDSRYRPGVNFQANGFGSVIDGQFTVKSVSHSISAMNGFTTSIDGVKLINK